MWFYHFVTAKRTDTQRRKQKYLFHFGQYGWDFERNSKE